MGAKYLRNITKILKSASGVLYGRSTSGTGRGEEIAFASIPALIGVYTTAQVDSIIGGIEGLTSADIDTLAEINAILTDADLASISYVDSGLSGKQATLVSGTNIKTINSTSLLGSGNIAVSASPGGSSGQVQYNNAGAFGGMTAVVYAGSGTLVTVTSQAASDVPLLVKGAASQSGNLIETRNSSNTVLTAITSAGDILCGMLRSSTGATTSAIYVAEGLRKRWELSGAEQNQYMTTGCAFDGGSNWILIGGGGAPSYAPGSSTHRVSLDITNRIMYLGTNLLASPLAYTLAGTGGSGTNIAGGKITVAAGRSTGNATPAVVALASTTAGSSGTTLQTLRDGLQIDGNTTAAETPLLLLDIDKGTLQRVSIGASDSGGTGFKVLRVPN